MVATDLDGTLLRADGTISPRTRETLTQTASVGVAIVLVTARPPRFVRALAGLTGLIGLAVCCNGALVYDIEQDRLVRHAPLEYAIARRLVTGLRAALPGVCFAFELGERYGWEPGYALLDGALDAHDAGPSGRVGEALDLCATPITKLIVRHPMLAADALLPRVRELAGEDAYVTHSGAPFVEVSAAGVQKALAVEALCADLGVAPREVVAFGDMPNDLPLLCWAGRGVAVANAHPQVLRVADEVTLSNEEDGVAAVLERLLTGAGMPQRRSEEGHVMARSMTVGALFDAWDDLDRSLAGVAPAEMVEPWNGGSAFTWTYGHVTNMVDAWLNVRFQGLPPHPVIGDPDLRIGGSGRAADWSSIRQGVAEVRETTRCYLQELTESDLDRVIPYDGSVAALRAGGLSLRYALLRAIAHHHYHIGEIATKREQLGHVVGDLPIPQPAGLAAGGEE